MSYQYSKEARERIRALGQAAIAEFIVEVPQGVRMTLYRRFPKVDGFRPGEQAELKAKQKRLISLLTHPQASPKGAPEWEQFARTWEAWAIERLGRPLPRGDDTTLTAEAGLAFLRGLVEHCPQTSREDVARLFAFSGFPDHSDVETALARFRTAAVLERDRMLDGMPVRLAGIEASVDAIEVGASAASQRIGRVEAACNALARTVEQTRNSEAERTTELSQLRGVVDDKSGRLRQLENSVGALGTAARQLAETAKDAVARIAAHDDALRALDARHEGFAHALAEVTSISSAVDGLSVQGAGWAELAASVADLSTRLAGQEASLTSARAGATAVQGDVSQWATLVETCRDGAFVDLHRVEDVCDAIASNLQATGVTKGAAISIARQSVAALVAGQLIQLSGSLADLMADAIAAAIGGAVHQAWRVPVGLISDEVAAECMRSVAGNSGCLVLKGANRSAFEVYGSAIRDIVVRRQFGLDDENGFALIATWAQGPATFSEGGTLAELGPVFDTDALAMRGAFARLPQLRYGRLARKAWSQLDGIDTKAGSPASGELEALLDEAAFGGGALWRRIIYRAGAMLGSMPQGSPEADIHALLTAWALPWAKASSGPVEDIRKLAARELAARQTDEAA
ncbi:hypothetical protein [Cupriavidus sp. RAF12]|uniref:hypothetical protein n=1 Tax=Cupriavidus sp. RAF12 TaxID=3233050 RepID=UPI003F9223CF